MISLPTDLTATERSALAVAVELERGTHLPPAVRQALVRHLQPLEEEGRRLRLHPAAQSALPRTAPSV